MSAHKYIRILCNGIKVRSTGNEKWQREQVLEEELGYDVKNHESYDFTKCMMSKSCSDWLNPSPSGVHYSCETVMVYKIMNALLSLTPDWMVQNREYKIFTFQALLIRSSHKSKIKTIKDVYDIGFYLEVVHDTTRDLDLIQLKVKDHPTNILAFMTIKYKYPAGSGKSTDSEQSKVSNGASLYVGRSMGNSGYIFDLVNNLEDIPYMGDNVLAHD